MSQVPQPGEDLCQRVSHLGGVASGAVIGEVLLVLTAFTLDIPGQGGEDEFHAAAGGPEQGGAGGEDFFHHSPFSKG